MRKTIILLMAVFFVVGVVGLAAAAPANNVANTSQKGSVLIFSKIDITEVDGGPIRDTIVAISNDYFEDVQVKCYWVDKFQNIQDFMFKVTANQPAWFSAKTGLNNFDAIPIEVVPFAGPVGELKCWAVDAAGANQINFNHLYGTATVFDFNNASAYEYNSWNFQARTGVRGDPVGVAGNILLDGVAYDACPQYLLFNFPAVGADFGFFNNVDLTLVPCKQDLRQDRKPTFTKAKFDIWNENETKYTGAYQCIKCWFESYLDKIQVGAKKFTFTELHTTMGRFRVQGVASTVCTPVALASPLVGVSAELIAFGFEKVDAVAGTTPNSAGTDPTGFILWDVNNPGGIVPEAAQR